MTGDRHHRVALILPPVQSFFMPYSAPAVLAAWLQERCGARTLVIDAGMEWLVQELETADVGDCIESLRRPETYRDMWTVRRTHALAASALEKVCAPWLPERVELSGRYFPAAPLENWEVVRELLDLDRPSLFDHYYANVLIPRLQRFDPQVIGLSVPFDWMLLPTLRLARWLAARFSQVEIVVGGHAITRLWHERQAEFFDLLDAKWAAVGDGQVALEQLIRFLDDCTPPPPGGPLVRLPVGELTVPATTAEPGFLSGKIVPDFSDLCLQNYLRPTPILSVPASDGCFFGACLFCSRQRSDQSVAYIERPPEHVADLMRGLAARYGARQFILAEDIVSHRFMLGLARSLVDTELTWFCEASFKGKMVRRLSADDYTLLHDGGSRLILNGLESASERMRDMMGCSVDLDDYDQNMRRLVDSGIVPYVTMIFGYPGETAADVWESIRYMRRHAVHAVFATSRFWVVPGTPLARELQSRPDASCLRRSVLDGGLDYIAADTLDAGQTDRILTSQLPGAFGPGAQFLRSIPVLMQMLDGVDARSSFAVSRDS